MISEGIVSRLLQKLGNGVVTSLRITPGLGSLAVAQAEGEGDEASRGGIRFHTMSSGVTGIAPVQALPTNAAQWLLYNPAGSSVTVWLDKLGSWLVSGTAGAGGTLLCGVCGPQHLPTTRPTVNATNMVIANANPQSTRTAKLIVASAQTLVLSPGWAPLAFMNPAGTILGQTQMENLDIRGKFVLAPDTGLAIAVVSPTGTTPLFAPYGSHREYAADME